MRQWSVAAKERIIIVILAIMALSFLLVLTGKGIWEQVRDANERRKAHERASSACGPVVGTSIQLKVRPAKDVYGVGEPVYVWLEVTNHGESTIEIPVGCHPYNVEVHGPGISPSPTQSQVYVVTCPVGQDKLLPGKEHDDLFWLNKQSGTETYGDGGMSVEHFAIAKPGTYSVTIDRALIALGGKSASCSAEAEVKVALNAPAASDESSRRIREWLHQPTFANTLDDVVPRIDLSVGNETIGGAAMKDAVRVLRPLTRFPICFESVEFDRKRDAITMAEAAAQLRGLAAKGELAPMDASRLKLYEKLMAEQPGFDRGTAAFKQKTFKLVAENLTVRALLDRLVELDGSYVWTNQGTAKAPIIVIKPRDKSVLDWPIPRICGSPEELSSTKLYEPPGMLSSLLRAHGILLPELNRKFVPDVQLDLCRDHLTALDALVSTTNAAKVAWSLEGIKGSRWLGFSVVRTVEVPPIYR